MFECSNHQWCILTCNYVEKASEKTTHSCNENDFNDDLGGSAGSVGSEEQVQILHDEDEPYTLSSLITCFDNVKFCQGSGTAQLEYVLNTNENFVISFGSMEGIKTLYEELTKSTKVTKEMKSK